MGYDSVFMGSGGGGGGGGNKTQKFADPVFTPPLVWRFSRQNVGDTYMKFVYNDQFYYLESYDWNKSCLLKRN